MQSLKRFLSFTLVLIMFLSTLVITSNAYEFSPENGAFIFDNQNSLTCFGLQHNVDIAFDNTEKAVKFTVNSFDSDPDPRVLLKTNNYDLSANEFKYILIVYKAPTSNSSKATNFEVFLSAGNISGPMAGYSKTFRIANSNSYSSHIIDASKLTWWNGQIHSLRLDMFASAAYGDTMYIDSVILCRNSDEAILHRTERLAQLNGMKVYNPTYYSLNYDVSKYTSPFWKGNIVFNEAVYPIKGKDGSLSFKLMYTPDEIITVCDAQFSSLYTEGIDYTINGDTLTLLPNGSVNIKEYTYLHPTASMIPAGYNGWSPYYKRHAAGDGLYEYWTADIAKQYINVTYTHSDTWQGPVPAQSSASLPITTSRIENKGNLNIVYYGDSICGGARASSYENIYPYAEWWNQQITSKLKKDYGVNVNATISSVGGSDAEGMSESSKVTQYVTNYSPDLVFLEFGVNDAQNYAVGGNSRSSLKTNYKKGINAMISQIRSKRPNCEFVLVAPYYSNIYDFKPSYFEACTEALYEIANVTKGVAVADVTAVHNYLLGFKNYADFTGDNLCHPNDFMSRIYSQICLETIIPGGVEPYAVTQDEPEVKFEVGDVNMDGKVNPIDANELIKALTGNYKLQDETLGDLSGDGKISSSDVNILSKKILGLE